jgi:uncharacterized protein CbrC (UPF0167 family)
MQRKHQSSLCLSYSLQVSDQMISHQIKTDSLSLGLLFIMLSQQFWIIKCHDLCLNMLPVNSNLVQYLLQTDIRKRTEKIQWQIQTLHRDFSPGNPNRENQHILYSYIVLHCLQYNIHIGASGIQNPNPMTWISPKP